MGVGTEQVASALERGYDVSLFANPTRALSPAAERVIVTVLDAAAIAAAKLGLRRAGVIDQGQPAVVPTIEATAGGGDDAPRAAPPQMLPMWAADP